MGDQRLPEDHPDWVHRYKRVLKHKKEQLIVPPFIEGRHRLFSHEKLEDFKRDYQACEEILSRTIWRTFCPRISHEAPNTATNKCQRKPPQDLELFCSMSMDQQGSRRTQYKLHRLSQMKDDAEEHFINWLQMPKHGWNLHKWPHLGNQREANKKSKHGKHLHRKFNLGNPEDFRSCQRNLLPRNTSTNKNLIDSLNYRYTQRGSDGIYERNEALGNSDALQEFDMDHAYQPTYKDSADKKICHLPSKLKYFRGLSKEKDNIRFSKQASIFEMKLQNLHDPCKSTKEKFKYGSPYQKPNQLKALASEEPVTDPKSLLEFQGRSFCKPDVLENIYGIIAFKDFIIHKGYDMPGILRKFFMKKGWNYNSVNTPLPSILKNYELIMQKQDDENDEGEMEKELH
ncbi:protein FAM47A [Peromyscus californicus insignis]|uniref:protein FAM47A n=1 Tax=Peromyscus californicus insignis TaxID=564181 RepID=UPI0022A6FD54|nr:protein FAM47A [Peromyscus californicus insignis]